MKKSLLLLFVIFLLIPLSSKAKADLTTKNEVFNFLKDAFQVQLSLSEQTRTKEEISDLLTPYFSKNYQMQFWNENIIEEDGKYVTYGTDFAIFYIPFYQYTNGTKVIINSDSIYVFEHFPASMEGPVGYDSHYEGLLIKKLDGEWKVNEFLYNNIPESILDRAKGPAKQQK